MNNVIWKISIITTTPDLFPGPLQYSNVGKSLADGKWSLEIIPLEKRQNNKKVKIDGSPAGGGPGMIMRADIVLPIINNMRQNGDTRPLIVPAARGTKYDQKITTTLQTKSRSNANLHSKMRWRCILNFTVTSFAKLNSRSP